MGYTHYWDKEKEIELKTMKNIVDDFKKVLPELEKAGVPFAGGDGEGEPEMDYNEVHFNGSVHCGHLENSEIVIPWPTKNAGGIAGYTEKAKIGTWFAGAEIEKRVCNGDCSYESFDFERIITDGEPTGKVCYIKANGKPVYNNPEQVGKYFSCCKTAFRPYDLGVISFLIIAKHYLKENLIVHSDGTNDQWFDGKLICQMTLHYGLNFKLDK